MLEGLNGIGKTLAVRLLEVCTGTMPYNQHSAAWESLREGLGSVTVEVTGLDGAERVVWVADSADWKMTDGRAPSSDWFQSITIDGQAATLEAVRGLITVHRLAGDEGITDTFAARAESYAATFRRWMLRHADQNQGPLAELERVTAMAQEMLTEWSPAKWQELKRKADQAGDTVKHCEALALESQARLNEFERAVNLNQRLSEIRQRAPGLERELAEIDKQIEGARAEREEAQRGVAGFAAEVGRTEPLRRELRNARRTLERNRKALTQASNLAAAQAAALDLEPAAKVVGQRITELSDQETSLRMERPRLDAAPAMKELLADLSGSLKAAESRGLGGEIAVDDVDSGFQLNVSQTRAGMLARRTFLERQPPNPKAAHISEAIKRCTWELKRARALSETLQIVSRLTRLVNRNEDRVDNALKAGAAGQALEALRRASGRLRSSEQKLLDLASSRAAVAQRLGVSDENWSRQAVTQQLASTLRRLGLAEDELESNFTSAETIASQAQQELVNAQNRAIELRQDLSRAEADIRRAAVTLSADRRLAWLRTSSERSHHTAAQAGTDVEKLLHILEDAQNVASMVEDRLGTHRSQLSAVERALNGMARHIRGQTLFTSEYVEELRTWLANRFSDWFNNPRVSQELLPDSDGDIRVDLAARKVTWREHQRERSRPLEAFSSGEQAFAYTRARLARLDEEGSAAANRFIALDEFGAFIAHDRLQGLIGYLRERATEHELDQVLVILPLSRDYREMAQSAIGAEAERFKALADQVDERSYATQMLIS
jgi:hypothetical protein